MFKPSIGSCSISAMWSFKYAGSTVLTAKPMIFLWSAMGAPTSAGAEVHPIRTHTTAMVTDVD